MSGLQNMSMMNSALSLVTAPFTHQDALSSSSLPPDFGQGTHATLVGGVAVEHVTNQGNDDLLLV
jgi:hypothetical protein